MGKDSLHRASVLAEQTSARADQYTVESVGRAMDAAESGQRMALRGRQQDMAEDQQAFNQEIATGHLDARLDQQTFHRKMALRDANRLEGSAAFAQEDSNRRFDLDQRRTALDEVEAEQRQEYNNFRMQQAMQLSVLKREQLGLQMLEAQTQVASAEARQRMDAMKFNRDSRAEPYTNPSTGQVGYDVWDGGAHRFVALPNSEAKAYESNVKRERAENAQAVMDADPQVAFEQRWMDVRLRELQAINGMQARGRIPEEARTRQKQILEELAEGPPVDPRQVQALVESQIRGGSKLPREVLQRMAEKFVRGDK